MHAHMMGPGVGYTMTGLAWTLRMIRGLLGLGLLLLVIYLGAYWGVRRALRESVPQGQGGRPFRRRGARQVNSRVAAARATDSPRYEREC